MKSLTIGIVCYPSVGGSGIVATLLGIELARRGYRVHFISYDRPFRLPRQSKNIFFHRVPINTYQLFRYPDYTLPLAVTMSSVHQRYHLDIMHVHYAVPHATAALLARQIVLAQKQKAFRVITTLHGTDITLVGRDPNLMPIIRYSIEQSCGITAVSHSLSRETKKVFGITAPIKTIYNFYTPKKTTKSAAMVRRQLGVTDNEFLVSHVSNVRPVKRIPDLLHIIARVAKQHPVKLLVLSGGDFTPYQPLVKKLRLTNRLIVKTNISDIENYLNASDAGLYTSDHESFGMSILETMSYGRPVLATRAGGVLEVVTHGRTGLLYAVGDIAGFVNGIQQLITNKHLRQTLGAAAMLQAKKNFSTDAIVQQYCDLYDRIVRE